MIFITGDTHGKFNRIADFCKINNTTKDDILIILGDVGINYSSNHLDIMKKDFLGNLNITLFCIHGNHEIRPQTIESYDKMNWKNGIVYYEEQYPNLLFAKDGEIFDLNGVNTIVIGGAYSLDKSWRILYGHGWWDDEQPSIEIKKYVEDQLELSNWNVDVVLSHTIPSKYEPIEVFISGINQLNVDKSTEEWLDMIEDKLDYKKWYCGHYHTEKKVDKIEIMYNNFDMFYSF